MVLQLYGGVKSTCTQRVSLVLHEKKVPFEFHAIDFAKHEHKSPEYMKKQPFGQVPYIDDDGFILYESRAIGRYIATKYANQGTQLIPTDPKKNALFEQAASIEAFDFDPFASAAVFENVFKKFRGGTPDPAKFQELIGTLDKKLAVYDQILGKQKYLAGDELTLADLFHVPYARMLAVAGSNIIDQYPNVSRWFQELTSRPSWEAVKDEIKSVPSY